MIAVAMIYLLSNDLMFDSQVSLAGQAAGVEIRSFAACEQLMAALKAAAPDDPDATRDTAALVIVDLTMPNGQLESLNQDLAQLADRSIRRVAIGPHVHKDKLERAAASGWEVFTRGQFHSGFADIVK